MKQFTVKEFDPNKSYVIEASAGTGKTFNIVEMVDKLVNTYNEDLHSILIVTYTEKAAGELKSRIRGKITNADVDNAPIYTIHSFCQNTIKEFGLSANLPLNLNVIDESELYKFTNRYLREKDILKDISILVSNGQEINFDSLAEVFVKSVGKFYLDIFGRIDESIVSIEPVDEYQMLFDLLVAINESKQFSDLFEKFPDIEYHYKNLLDSIDIKSKEFAENLVETYKTGFYYNGSKYKVTKNWPKYSEDMKAFNFFAKLKNEFKKPNINEILAHMYLKDFYMKWQEEKEINKNQTFDDMIRYVREAILHDDKLKNKLKAKYHRAIIDEFQDTNQRQFDIFSSVFMEDDEHKIIVVGDPKQSIYSFQGADINVYYNAVKAIQSRGGEICMLNKNYRSTADMVDSCNKLFNYYDFSGTKFADCGFLTIKEDQKVHEALYDGKAPKAFWVATDLNGGTVSEREFAHIAVQQIIDCCMVDENGKTKLQVKAKGDDNFRNVSFKDFAVLARSSSEMKPIEQALKNAGIPYLRYKDKKLFLGKECAHWVSVLEAINTIDFTGSNRKKFKKALFTIFFNVPLKEIDNEKYNQDDISEMRLINKWKQFAYNRNWEDLFDDIIVSSGISERMKSLKEIQSLAIYKQIGNYCIEYLSKGKSLDDLIRNLSSLSKGGEFEGDDQNGTIVEKSTNFDCVQIMTIHASKGLQFPVVIGVCGFKGPYTQGKVYTYHEKEKQMITFKRNETYKEEEIAEWKRLYYVAYTRPQFILLLPNYDSFGATFLKESTDAFMKNHIDAYRIVNNTNLSYNTLRMMTSAILANSNKSTEDIELKVKQDKVMKKIIKEGYSKKSYKHSYSSLSHEEETIVDEDETNKEGIIEEGLAMFDKLSKVVNANYDEQHSPITLASDYPRGAKLGTALHEVFETLDFSNHQERLELIINRCFLNQGVIAKEEWIESTKLIVENVIHATLPIVHGSNVTNESLQLKEITLENKKDEVEFNFNLLKGRLKNYCNGFVDLIFKNGDYYSIVDWKSDNLSEDFESYSKVDSLKKHVDDCYSIQRVLYSYCLIKWLKMYMPTLSEQEIFDKHFGGIYYVFLRGCNSNNGNGIYCQTWNSYSDLEKSFNEIINAKVGGNENE